MLVTYYVIQGSSWINIGLTPITENCYNCSRQKQIPIFIAGQFIQKNPSQIKKRLISPKHLENPIVIADYDDTSRIRQNWGEKVEEVIGRILEEYGEGSSILLIGRYNFDIYNLVRTGLFHELTNNRLQSVKYPKAKITTLTAHSSKGLGFENVVLINMQEGKFGFPSQIEDDPILKLVTYTDYSVPFAEERRLFYVAMTRTRNRVYMIVPQKRPSRFVVELIKDFNIPHSSKLNLDIENRYTLKCPVCSFPLKYENNKNYGIPLYICTNEPEICDFMTNDRQVKRDIFKCPRCPDGYMVIKKNRDDGCKFYGCTNYKETGCNYAISIKDPLAD